MTSEAGGGEGLVMQDLKGLIEDICLYSETPEENAMIRKDFESSLWLLYTEWIWGGDSLGSLPLSRRERMAY